MVGSATAAISSTVRTPNRSMSSTTRSLCTTCPRIAPRPPPAANRFTLRSAIRTPEQKPYFSARLTFIAGPNVLSAENILNRGSWLAVRGSRTANREPRTTATIPIPMAETEPLFTPRFAALWVYAFVTFFSAFQLLPAIPFRILELGGSKAEAGWFLSVYTYASAFAAPLMGSIADHVGRRRLLITASVPFIIFSIAYGVITNLPLLLIVGAIHGSIWSAILSSASAIMSEYIPVSRRAQGIAYWGLASTGAIAVAPAVGLWVFHFGWITLCLELATLSVLMTVGALFI